MAPACVLLFLLLITVEAQEQYPQEDPYSDQSSQDQYPPSDPPSNQPYLADGPYIQGNPGLADPYAQGNPDLRDPYPQGNPGPADPYPQGKSGRQQQDLQAVATENEATDYTNCFMKIAAQKVAIGRAFPDHDKEFGIQYSECYPDGTFKPVQCHGAQCYCARSDGEKIYYTRNGKSYTYNFHILLRFSATCACARARDKAAAEFGDLPGRPQYMCKQNGNFEAVQCIGSECFCVDDFGNQKPGTAVNRAQADSTGCRTAK